MAKKTDNAAAPKAPAKKTEAKKIEPKIGSMVQVKIVKQPSSDKATKTLKRILGKDRETHKEKEFIQKLNVRSMRSKRRGGVWYELNNRKRDIVNGEVGESGVVKATVDVIRDLNSVARFVEVTAAK